MIKTQVIGHLGKDAIVSNVNGRNVINFSVAHSSTYLNKQGQKIENTIWVNCSYWIERTKVSEYLTKGSLVYVEGKPSLDRYINEQGVTIPQLKLRVDAIQLLGNKTAHPAQVSPGQQHDSDIPYTDEPIEDLPF